jgi:hypothetical protein
MTIFLFDKDEACVPDVACRRWYVAEVKGEMNACWVGLSPQG